MILYIFSKLPGNVPEFSEFFGPVPRKFHFFPLSLILFSFKSIISSARDVHKQRGASIPIFPTLTSDKSRFFLLPAKFFPFRSNFKKN